MTSTPEKEEVGLSSWPMSKSYPATSTNVEKEARKIMKTLTTRKRNTEVVLKTEEEHLTDPEETWSERVSCLIPDCCAPLPEISNDDVDEVDGLAEDVLRPLVKLVFLKILLVDIGISLGDVVTDLLQGLSLVFDQDWNVQWNTYHYGLGVLGVMWLPGLVALLHHASGEARYTLLPVGRHWLVTFSMAILVFLCFPLLPTFFYFRVLTAKKRFRTSYEKLLFLELEAKTNELKAIAGAIESPLELILLLWLLLRGILRLPWDQPLASSCVEDSLGRVACLPSLPVASIIFSLLSILKTLFDLNISPLLSRTQKRESVIKLQYSTQLMAQFCPFFVCNILLRTTAFAFIITFLDYWAVIPGVATVLLSVAHTGLVSYSSPREEEQSGLEGVDGPGSQDEASGGTEEVDGPALLWDGHQWISRSGALPAVRERDTRSSCSEEVESTVPSRPMPILLNSLLGLFLPVAYTPCGPQELQFPGKLKAEVKSQTRVQARTLRSQALLINCCTFTVVAAIYCLVTHTVSFNYRTNILSPWWFSLAFWYLLLMSVLSFFLSWTLESSCLEEEQEDQLQTAPILRQRSRHPTGESSRHSVHSASSQLVLEEQGPRNLHFRATLSAFLTVLVLAPSILGIVLFKMLPEDNHQLLHVQEGDGGVLLHLSHLTSLSPQWRGGQVPSSLLTGCDDPQRDFSDTMLLLNLSTSGCRTLYRRLAPGVFGAQPPRALIILDSGPETGWRLSSPSLPVDLGPDIPVFRARTVDWTKDWSVDKVSVIKGMLGNEEIKNKLSCSYHQKNIYIGNTNINYMGCKERKWLMESGRVFQKKCLLVTCSHNGVPCDESFDSETTVQCHKNIPSPQFLVSKNGETKVLPPHKMKFLNGESGDTCCSSESEYIQYFGQECEQALNVSGPNSNFSEQFASIPCSKDNLQYNMRFCKAVSLVCIVSKYSISVCGKINPINSCDINNLNCNAMKLFNE